MAPKIFCQRQHEFNSVGTNGVVNLTWSGDLFTSFVVDSNPQALTGSLNLTDGTLITFSGGWTVPDDSYFGHTSGTAYFYDPSDPGNVSDILTFDNQGSVNGASGTFSGSFISESSEGSLGPVVLPDDSEPPNVLFNESNGAFSFGAGPYLQASASSSESEGSAPEPGSWLLFGSGLSALAALVREKRVTG